MGAVYNFESMESLIDYINSGEYSKWEDDDIVTFSIRTVNGDMVKCAGYISSLGLNPLPQPESKRYKTITPPWSLKGSPYVRELEKIRQQILENIKEETLECPIIKPNIIPTLLAPVEPVERSFPEIETENRRWFEEFDKEILRHKRNYINKANPKKGSANYETQRIRNTEQIVHRQHRCQER